MEARLFGRVTIVLASLRAIERVRSRRAITCDCGTRPIVRRSRSIERIPSGWVLGMRILSPAERSGIDRGYFSTRLMLEKLA